MRLNANLPVVGLIDGITGRVQPGGGEAILWLHGYTLDSSSWGQIWSLMPGWEHVGPDLPGHGGSDPVSASYNLTDVGHRLGMFCRERGIRHLAALSFGTLTAMEILIQFPDLFASVVLGAPALAGGHSDPEMAESYSKLIGLYRREGPTPALQRIWLQSRAWRGIEKAPGLRELLSGLVARHRWTELGAFAWMRQFTAPTKLAELERIRSEVLVLVGEDEMPAFRKNADLLEKTIPRCVQRLLPATDHLCMLQAPALAAPIMDRHFRTHAHRTPEKS
ncbi:MAG: alpha/beta hydrolase [Deltaproteobacteria bacterium]|nr:alpha/beta hydrolase [Deltaproteobacteria bacterium]